jgi:Domain of unknown function (DUF4126)
MDTALSIALGIGLSAACGFRVFVPLLILSVAAYTGNLSLSSGFEWIGTLPAVITFGTATGVEILAYYVPWLGHLLDTIATPAAVVAGIVASASVFTEISPLFKWILALIGGGGIAGLVQGATVVTRIKSTALTGGLGNPVVSTAELFGSVATSFLALFVPIICVLMIAIGIYLVFRSTGRLLFGRQHSSTS